MTMMANCNIVNSLPDYAGGTLPFKLETGYISVGENEEIELFYYFVESEGDPSRDPLILWLTGGPGCTGFYGFLYEFGPLTFDFSIPFPTLVLRPDSWTKVASFIFVDSPVGTGFSYATTSQGYDTSDTKATKDNYKFIRKWLLHHPKFINNHLYIGGDSYAGMTVPQLAVNIAQGNEDGLHPHMNLQGYIVGNTRADTREYDYETMLYANRMGIISDEIFELAKSSCDGEYVSPDPDNHQCLHALARIKECTDPVNLFHILEPKCTSSELMGIFGVEDIPGDSLLPRQEDIWCHEKHELILNDLEPKCISPQLKKSRLEHSLLNGENNPADTLHLRTKEPQCRMDNYWRSDYCQNNKTFQEALHVRKGTVKVWKRCNTSLSYDFNVQSVLEHHQLLINKGYRVLAYSGDHDLAFPYTTTLKWIHDLKNLTIDKEWRPWTVEGQVAGYTETYKNSHSHVTFATVMGAGHTGAEYKPKECLAMVTRWLSRRPL